MSNTHAKEHAGGDFAILLLAAGGSAYLAPIEKRTPRDAAQDAAELCRLANSLNRLNEIACNCGLTERQERRKQDLQPGSRPCLGL
jgi:hypothetical protein